MFPAGITLQQLNDQCKNTMISFLGIEFTELGKDFLEAKMPVNEKTRQPLGLLHGGASVVLAETLGSLAASLVLDSDHYPVGLEINANHIRSAKNGVVTGRTRALHVGRTTHVWNIEIFDEANRMIATSRITMAIMKRN